MQDNFRRWSEKAEKFLKPATDEDAEAKTKRLRTKTADGERVPTLQWLQCIANALRLAGKSLQQFAAPVFANEADLAHLTSIPVLVVTTDQEALQITGCNFLKHKKNLGLIHVYDPMHRRQNDCILAMGECGILRRCSTNLALYNIKYGPWLKSGWFGMLQETARSLKDLPPNDPLLMFFWPSILKDRDFALEDSQEGRQFFLKTLMDQQFLKNKGPKTTLSKFNALSEAHRLIDNHWSSQCYIMTVTCLLQGWVQHSDELWCPESAIQKAQEEADGRMSRARAKRKATDDLNRMRAKAVNSLHAMTKYMNDDIVKSESRMIAAVMEPEAAAAGLMLKEMRSPEKTLDYFVSWAHWGWLDTAKAHLQLFHDTRTLDRIGFCMAWDVETDQGELDWEEASASKLWSFLRSVLKYRAGSNLWHTWGPGASAGLLCEDEEGRKAALKWHRDLFEAVAAVKQHGSHGAQALIKDTMCNEILQRYIFQSLRAANFLEVPAALSRFLQKIWSGLLNSKLVEDANKFQRQHEDRSNNSKTLPLGEAWHCVSQHQVLKQYERREVQPQAHYSVPTDFYLEDLCRPHAKRTRKKTAAEEEDFEFLSPVTKACTWPAFTPETEQRLFCGLALLVHLHQKGRGSEWSDAAKAWMSGIVPEHTVLEWKQQPHFVLRTYPRGVLLWPLKTSPHSGHLTFDREIGGLTWGILFSLDNVMVRSFKVLAPVQAARSDQCGLQLQASPPKTILQHQQDTGFKGLNESQMNLLLKHLGFQQAPAGSKDQELGTAIHLLVNLDPSLQPDEVLQRMKVRNDAFEGAVEEMTEELLEVLQDTVRQQDQQKIVKELENRKRPLKSLEEIAKNCYRSSYDMVPMDKVKKAVEDRKAREKREAEEAEQEARSKNKGQESNKKRKFPRESEAGKERHYDTLDEAVDKKLRQTVPSPAVSILTDEGNGRWNVTYRQPGGFAEQKSVSWTNTGAPWAAAQVLKWSWSMHKEHQDKDLPAATKKLIETWEAIPAKRQDASRRSEPSSSSKPEPGPAKKRATAKQASSSSKA